MSAAAPAASSTGSGSLVDAGGLRVVPAGEWDALLDRMGIGDWYFRHGYVCASAVLEPGSEPVLVHMASEHGELALPMLVRDLPGDAVGRDAVGAYGYGGPVAFGEAPTPARFGEALDEWCRANGIVSSFHRFHPLAANVALAPARCDVVEVGATVAWRTDGDHDLEGSMHKHHRRVVRKSRREGVVTSVREVAGVDDLAEFREVYDETMRRQAASGFYFFGEEYWRRLAGDVGGGSLVLVEAHDVEGDLLAGLLCAATAPTLHYHLGASTDRARALGASNACFLAGAEWARSHGLSRFHLGGGVGGRADSLHDFKRRFDPESEPHRFHIGRQVHDADRYRELSGGDAAAVDGFFPAYRAPRTGPA